MPVFVLALSGSQLACGLVSTVPLVAGALVQLVSPWMVRRWRSYRQWVVFCAAVQAATFLPLIAAAMAGAMPLTLVFAIISIYWAAGLAGSSPWNAWMETLVPQRVRTRYFAWRTRVNQWGVTAGFIVGGVLLQFTSNGRDHLGVFAILFLVAAGSRFLSAGLLASQREPMPPRSEEQGAGNRERRPATRASLLSALRSPLSASLAHLLVGDNRRLLYLLAVQTSVQIAGPYFNPYMLRQLQFSYFSYVSLICVATIAKILVLPTLGRIVDRMGVRRIFWLSGIAIVPLPALWIISGAFPYLVGVQILSGVAWAACDLATLMMFFETIPRHKRVDVLTAFNLANAAATAAGSLIGGAVLAMLGTHRETYLIVFALSACGRAASLLLLVRTPATAALRRAKIAVWAGALARGSAGLLPARIRVTPRPAYRGNKPNAMPTAAKT